MPFYVNLWSKSALIGHLCCFFFGVSLVHEHSGEDQGGRICEDH